MQSVQLPKAVKSGLFKAIKAGVRGEFPSSESGTPQGGVISPLLANLVLHGLEDIGNKYTKSGLEKRGQTRGFRYADDVVYILQPNDDAGALRVRIDDFLASRGLKVKEAKTKLVHSIDGFDFLGWHLKVKPNGKFISTPSQASYRQIKDRVKETMKDNRFNLEQRIAKCGLIVRGWRNYHKFCDMSTDNLWFSRYWTWKYIRKQGSYNRQQTNQVIETAFPPIKWSVNSHINVQGDKSPFDGDTIYWSQRSNKSYSGLTANLMKRQKHTCNQCGLKFFPGDIFELHHIDGDCLNQKRTNMEILHRGCHQHKSIHREVRVRKAV
jgi:5-methylcytosine-specific restriction endonuclease McrA